MTPQDKLAYLYQRKVDGCTKCKLCETREHIVFGEGHPEADLMFIGEAPGAFEDRSGRPFVGQAGHLLDQWIASLGLNREDVYIANIIKCRPPKNRDPFAWEIKECVPYLRVQISIIRPKAIVSLGRFASEYLTDVYRPMRELRGEVFRWSDEKAKIEIPVVPIYHPAYVLRAGHDAGETAKRDLKRVRDFL